MEGRLIQEGDDNIDINTQTLDGKGTYHSMARVIFQQQDSNSVQESQMVIKRPKEAAAQERSLKMEEGVKK